MRSDFVVIPSPIFDNVPGMLQIHEPVRVQALIAESPVKALGEGVLNGFAGTNEVELDSFAVGPLVQCLPANSGPLSTVITSGSPLASASLSRTPTTLAPPNEVSTSIAGDSRE